LRGEVIMVGRDIGTVVLPEADLKIYLDASVEERAKRRCKQRIDRGGEADYEQILKALKKRDRKDSTREIAPLRAAADAVIINTDELSIDDVVSRIEALAGGSSD
jgi:cytidylate kinase